jgi:hypothetical protein
MRFLDKLFCFSKTKEADEVTRKVIAARVDFERSADELTKTLDEMLKATTRANNAKRSRAHALPQGKPQAC